MQGNWKCALPFTLVHPSLISGSSPPAQVKARAVQVGDRDWNWERKILCSTIRVLEVES